MSRAYVALPQLYHVIDAAVKQDNRCERRRTVQQAGPS